MRPSYATAVHGFAPLGAAEALDAGGSTGSWDDAPPPKKKGAAETQSAAVPITLGIVALGLAGALLVSMAKNAEKGAKARATR
jgi:hypothetical protein